jgi:hypothetical protein
VLSARACTLTTASKATRTSRMAKGWPRDKIDVTIKTTLTGNASDLKRSDNKIEGHGTPA